MYVVVELLFSSVVGKGGWRRAMPSYFIFARQFIKLSDLLVVAPFPLALPSSAPPGLRWALV